MTKKLNCSGERSYARKLLIIAIFATAIINFAYSATDKELSDSIAKKLQQPIKTHFGAFNFDIFDFPQDEGGILKLEKVREQGSIVNINEKHKDQIVVLVAVNPEDKRHGEHWKLSGKSNHAIDGLRKFCKEYSDKGVAIYAVWLPKKAKDRTKNLANALAYAKKTDFPCPLTVETAGFKKKKDSKMKSAFTQYIGLRTPGHTFPAISCIKDKNNKIVNRGYEYYTGFSYHTTKHLVDRILDPEYDKAVRVEFAGTKSRVLPITEKKDGGVLLKDDFEGYKNSHDLKLQPRWGFSYERQSRLDLKASLLKNEGREGSTAAEVTVESSCLNTHTQPLQHKLAEPLRNGYIRFFVKRHPNAKGGDERTQLGLRAHPSYTAHRSFCATFGQPGTHYSAGHLFATGKWGKETFVTNWRIDQTGKVAFSANNWHEVLVECNLGKKAIIKIDGQMVGELKSESIDWVGFRMNAGDKERSFLIDDFEVFYKDKTSVDANYAKNYQPSATYSAEEQKWIHKEFTVKYKGDKAAELAEGAISRADFTGGRSAKSGFFYDHPIEVDEIILEDLKQKGKMVNILEKYKGKIIWFAPLVKGDHAVEHTMRPRTVRCSPTLFNRAYTLAMEYKNNPDVVVIGIACYDGGHRNTSTSSEDKKRTFMETINSSKDLADEMGRPKTKIIYGAFDEAFDEILWESHANKMRLWNKILRGKICKGSFAIFGPDVVIDQKSRCVFRGRGGDGFNYWKPRYAIERLLDPDFDNAVRQEFRNKNLKNYRSPYLPIQEKRANGLAYKDDFESYFSKKETDLWHGAYNFALQPRWGFSYSYFPDFKNPAMIHKGSGINSSSSLLINQYATADTFGGNKPRICGKHFFPTSLTDGHFSMFVRRGPLAPSSGGPALFRFGLIIYGENGKKAQKYTNYDLPQKRDFKSYHSEVLTTLGVWKKETFGLVDPEKFMMISAFNKIKDTRKILVQDSKIPMAKDAWQEIKIICKKGQKAKIQIDGKDCLTLETEFITGIEFRAESWSGTYVDNVELFYKGNADELKIKHEQALKEDFEQRKQQWAKEE